MNFSGYFEKFEQVQRWVNNDLRNSTILGKANFLVAMGLFNYTEMLGGYVILKTPKTQNTTKRRFDYVFKYLFPQSYRHVFNELNKITSSAYDCLRCGMTHEYLIKTYKVKGTVIELSYTIYGVDDVASYSSNIQSLDCGLKLITTEANKYHLKIYNPRMIFDLNQAFENLKLMILEKTYFRKKFIKRCKEIKLENFC